jgi:hypothetical protein
MYRLAICGQWHHRRNGAGWRRRKRKYREIKYKHKRKENITRRKRLSGAGGAEKKASKAAAVIIFISGEISIMTLMFSSGNQPASGQRKLAS